MSVNTCIFLQFPFVFLSFSGKLISNMYAVGMELKSKMFLTFETKPSASE